jgi:hypothetical protein
MDARTHDQDEGEPEDRGPTAAPVARPRFLDGSNPSRTASVVREVMPAHSNLRSALLYTALAATVIVFDLVHVSAFDTSRVEPELTLARPTSVDSVVRPPPIDKQTPELVFIGNQDISPEELRHVFNGRSPQSLVDNSGALRQDGLDRGLLSIFYWDHGYANLKHPLKLLRRFRTCRDAPEECRHTRPSADRTTRRAWWGYSHTNTCPGGTASGFAA